MTNQYHRYRLLIGISRVWKITTRQNTAGMQYACPRHKTTLLLYDTVISDTIQQNGYNTTQPDTIGTAPLIYDTLYDKIQPVYGTRQNNPTQHLAYDNTTILLVYNYTVWRLVNNTKRLEVIRVLWHNMAHYDKSGKIRQSNKVWDTLIRHDATIIENNSVCHNKLCDKNMLWHETMV